MHSHGSKKLFSVTKEIRLFHLRILLTSLNICSYRIEKKYIGSYRKAAKYDKIIYYIALSKTREKMSCSNKNIQQWGFKKLRCNIKIL